MSGHIISIYSSKGGVGKTFIAVNLAVDLCKTDDLKVLLIDFNYPFSTDIAQLLNLKSTRSIEQMIVKKIKTSILHTFVTSHSSGISVVSLSEEILTSLDHLSPYTIENIIYSLTQTYDFIIIDIGMNYCQHVAKLLDISSFILLPFILDPLSVQIVQKDIGFFQKKSFPKEMIKLIANKTGENNHVDYDYIVKQFHKNERKITISIPYDKNATSNMSCGTYPTHFMRDAITQAFDRLTQNIIEESKSIIKDYNIKNLEDNNKQSDLDILKYQVHEQLMKSTDFKKIDPDADSSLEKREKLKSKLTEIISRIIDFKMPEISRRVRGKLIRSVLQEAMGLGPVQDLLADNDISEIMVNKHDQIYVEKKGKIILTDKKFQSEQHLLNIISKIVSSVGRKIDIQSPMVDARLKDGSRVNAIINPLAINGAALTIRKFFTEKISIDDMINLGSMNRQIADFLQAVIFAKLNVLIAGGTGSGKTTLLNVLSGFIPEDERVITIEDVAELKLRQPHVISLESRPKNIQGKGEITIKDLVKNSLRMRPDRIVVGECRGAESFDMLQAMNTGHDGSLTTIHANSSYEAVDKLANLVLEAVELPQQAIKEQIAGAIDIIIHIKRYRDGSRKISQISEITGIKDYKIILNDIFRFKPLQNKQSQTVGDFISENYKPACLERFDEMGIRLLREIFWGN